MKMNALPPGATGLLAELAGAQPMSAVAKSTQVAPEKAERTTSSVQSKADEANQAMQDAEMKVEEAQKAIRKAHLKGEQAKEAASFDEAVLANRAQEGRLALKNATKLRHRRHARKLAARVAAANGGQPAKMPKFGPEGRADDFPNEPYKANMSRTVDLKQVQAKRAARKAQRQLKQRMMEEAKAAREEAQAEEKEKEAGRVVEAHFAGKAPKAKKAHLMKELPSPSPLPAIITTDPVGDAAAAAAAAAAATDPAAQGEKSLPGCHSIALISDSWCTNNCLMGNCPKDMCSDECFAEPVVVEVRSNATPTDAAAVSPAPKEEAQEVDPSECRSINDAIASDSWCMPS